MQTKPLPNGWLRILDMAGMVIAPISISLPFFFGAILNYQTENSTGTDNNYKLVIVLFIGALCLLILLGSLFGGFLKRYVNHQVTRDEVKVYRRGYSILILGSFIVDFMILAYLLYGPKP